MLLAIDGMLGAIRLPHNQAALAEGKDWDPIPEEFATGCAACRTLTDFVVTPGQATESGRASVEASYRLDGEPRLMTVDLVREDGRWRVDDISSPDGSWNLRARLEELDALSPGSPFQTGDVEVAMTFAEGARTVEISLTNPGPGVVCTNRNYSAIPRLAALCDERLIEHPFVEGRPPPGCQEIAGGESLAFSYDLEAIYGDAPLGGATLCYSVDRRHGPSSDEPYSHFRARVCRTVPEQR
jgi:hypothetical protein